MRAGRWPVASLRVPHGGVDGRAGGVRNVQVGQQRAHVQGIGVPDEDLTEDRGVGGKQYALPGGVAVYCEAPSGAMAEAPDWGDAVAQGVGLGAGRRGDLRREGGGAGR